MDEIDRIKKRISVYESLRGSDPEMANATLKLIKAEIDALTKEDQRAQRISEKYSDSTTAPDPLLNLVMGLIFKVIRFVTDPEALKRTARRRSVRALFLILVFSVIGWMALDQFYLSKHGLIGEYYSGRDFDNLVFTRKDLKIDFRWHDNSGGPFTFRRAADFSVRWTGYLDVPVNGDYEISILSDDGCRVYIDDVKIIEDWATRNPTRDSYVIPLSKGPHKIKIEYFQGVGLAMVQLYWKKPGESTDKVIGLQNFLPNI